MTGYWLLLKELVAYQIISRDVIRYRVHEKYDI